MVNADHAQGWALAARRQGHGDRGLVEGRGDVVDGDRVVGVRAVRGLVVCVFIYHYSLWDFASSTHVSALTSQMTDSRRFADESVSTLTNGGILADK